VAGRVVDARASARLDPPVLRLRFAIAARLEREAFLAEARRRASDQGWDDERFESLLRHGGVHLDGRPYDRDDLPEAVAAATEVDLHALAWEPGPVAISSERILLDRDGVVAVDKPAGLPTQRTRASRLHSLEAVLREKLACPTLTAAHRLDRETSGVVVFASDPATVARVAAAFREGRARRRYRAQVSPPPARERFAVEGFLGRVLDPRRYRFALRDEPEPGFRWSATRFRVLESDAGRAIVEAEPMTGRTHQLRVHLGAAGSPIVGDPLYGGEDHSRLLLHAESLALELADETLAFAAPLPADFALPIGGNRAEP
jgi:23S rRNA pseudouridine1911/1915/1917 synthase